MSAKGRGEQLGGELEVYPTPTWCVRRLLERCVRLRAGHWLEPCAGYGAILRAVAGAPWPAPARVSWTAVEIREEVQALLQASATLAPGSRWAIADFFHLDPGLLFRGADFAAVVTNPPFSLALRFLQRCMEIAPTATIAFLLRTNFISGAEDRYGWLRDHMPDEYRLPDRPIFRGDHADSAEYSWFVWEPGAGLEIRRRGFCELLDPTPLAERKRDLEEAQALLAGVEFVAPQLELGVG